MAAEIIPAPVLILTPCIGTCRLDANRRVCLGCRRTLDEIASWSGYSDDERARIMAELPLRPS